MDYAKSLYCSNLPKALSLLKESLRVKNKHKKVDNKRRITYKLRKNDKNALTNLAEKI